MTAPIHSLLADELDIPDERARKLLHTMIEEIRIRVTRGNGVRIQDFGTFKKENGRVQFIPDPSLSRLVNHRFEGLKPETLYLEEPADTPPDPYPRPSEPEKPDFSFETEIEDADRADEADQEAEEEIVEVEADPEKVDMEAEASSEITDSAEDSSPSEEPSRQPEAAASDASDLEEASSEDEADTDMEATEESPEDTAARPEDASDEEEDSASAPEDSQSESAEEEPADEADAIRREPEDDSFYPMLDQIIGVEESKEKSGEAGAANNHPLAGIRAALTQETTKPSDDTDAPTDPQEPSEADSQTSEPSQSGQNSFESLLASSHSDSRSGGTEESSPQPHSSRSSYFFGGERPPYARSEGTSHSSGSSIDAQRIVAGIAILLLAGAGIWFVLGQYEGTNNPGGLPGSNQAYNTVGRSPASGSSSSTNQPSTNQGGMQSRSNDTQAQEDTEPPSSTANPSAESEQISPPATETSIPDLPSEVGDDASPSGINPAAGGWTVVVRSRASRQSAEEWLNEHREQFTDLGFQVDVLQGRANGRMWYRVAVGQFSSLGQARSALSQHDGIFPRDAWPLRLSS